MPKNHNNRNWYTLFIHDDDGNFEVLAHIRGEGATALIVHALRPIYNDRMRTLEGCHTAMTPELRHKYLTA